MVVERYIIKRCAYCGKEFVTTYSNKMYCCYEHKEQAKNRKKHPFVKKICACCGKEFKTNHKVKIYCSKKCCDKLYSSTKNKLRGQRALKNGPIDYSVTLSKLIERDNHICKLCGKPVDETDYTYVGDTFIAGNFYPSIDHIIPLSKGGTHQWNNVQLAHRVCNSKKFNR